MIYLLHGKDSFQVHRALEAIRSRLNTPDGLLETNTIVLDGAKLTPLELLQHATAMPFLAPARLVIVEGLLTALGSSKGGRGRKGDDPLAPWRDVAIQLGDASAVPDTTTLVLAEGDLGERNAAFTIFAPIAQTTEFQQVRERDLMSWVKQELAGRSLKMTDDAIKAMVDAVGPDLWAMYNELDKLETFAAGRTVDVGTVTEMVAQLRETKLWDLTDAITAGNERKAVGALGHLIEDGEPAALLSSMIARQYRQLAIVKELRDHRATEGEIARAAGVPGWKATAVSTLAGRYSWADLRNVYRLLLDADLSVKRGLQDDNSALQLLVHELCAMAPSAAARAPAYAR